MSNHDKPTNELTGKPIDRVDGRLKVTGAARYAAEFPLKDLAYGVAVTSTIASGHISTIDTSRAEKVPGVLGILTYKNSMSLHFPQSGDPGGGKYAEKDLLPLQSDRIFYDGQLVAVAIADTLPTAQYAASLVRLSYHPSDAVFDIQTALPKAKTPKAGLGSQELQSKRGDAAKAFETAGVQIKQTYTTPVYHHNAMEPHATTAQWQDDHLLIYDATQAVYGSRNLMASMLGLDPENVRVIAYYIGGGFGSKGFSWPNTVTAAMAAKLVHRPVQLVLSRQQMFTTAGRRSQTIQTISLGATNDGRLISLEHATTCETSFVDQFIEPSGKASTMLYACPNADISHTVASLNRGTPCPMRAPGEATGTYALEAAMDELAVKLNMDPIALRLANYAGEDPQKNKPFSAKYLRECYERGAAAIGWKDRNPQPRSMRQGNYLVGYGMATATYPANRSASTAKAILYADGRAEIQCCTQDIGTGTYTIMTQIAADALDMPIDKVHVKLGDSDFPKGANSGGSQVSASVGPAIRAACLAVIEKLEKLAEKNGVAAETTETTPTALLARLHLDKLEATATTDASTRGPQTAPFKDYSLHSFGAQFVKVLVDPVL